jgi:hypothetical protein
VTRQRRCVQQQGENAKRPRVGHFLVRKRSFTKTGSGQMRSNLILNRHVLFIFFSQVGKWKAPSKWAFG